ncbi:adenine deaminase, partial [Desulfovibrio desulfuricans]|nr:adenine deaminase [Desulfovibrio desulfuricans]
YVASLGEMMNYPGVRSGAPEVLEKLALRRSRRTPGDGHAPALLGRELDAYLCTGIANTHECTTAEEFPQNLMRGCRSFLRDGSAARNLPALAPL